jgi:hypothetical protein
MFDNKQSTSFSAPDKIETNELVGLAKHWQDIFYDVFLGKHWYREDDQLNFLKEFSKENGFTFKQFGE